MGEKKPSWLPGGVGGQKESVWSLVVPIVSAVVLTLGILAIFALQGKEVSITEALVVMCSAFAVLGLGGAKRMLSVVSNLRGGGKPNDDDRGGGSGGGPAIGGGMLLLVVSALLSSGCGV